jgi:Holliday junction resolvase RusA-like endonuclease
MSEQEKARLSDGPLPKSVLADSTENSPVTIALQGIPVPKGRPRISSYRGRVRVHTPEASKTYEEAVRLTAWREMRGRKPFEGAVQVELRFQFAPPASWSEKKKLAAIAGEIPHTSKPDADNLAKSWLDAMNRIVFSDDAAVTKVTASKRYSAASLAVATVKEADHA